MFMTPLLLDRVVRVSPYLLLGSLVVIALAYAGMIPMVLSVWLIAIFAASAMSLGRWRTEPGLWMLAALMTGLALLFLVACVWGGVHDFMRGHIARSSPVSQADRFVVVPLLIVMWWFFVSVLVRNRRLTHHHN